MLAAINTYLMQSCFRLIGELNLDYIEIGANR